MVLNKKKGIIGLPMETEIELIAIKGKEVHKKVMKYGDALNVKKRKGWIYKYYQIGYSQYDTETKTNT